MTAREARWSAAASLLLVLLPLLFQVDAAPAALHPLAAHDEPPVAGLLALTLVVLAWNALYGFALVSTAEADRLRGTLSRPTVLSYIDGWLVGALLPFTFAWFATHRRYGLAALTIVADRRVLSGAAQQDRGIRRRLAAVPVHPVQPVRGAARHGSLAAAADAGRAHRRRC